MQNSNIPAKFPIPFANAAGSSYIRTVPQASQIGVQNGAASLTDGFPPNCFVPVSAGGSWPFGQDFNGILNQATAWIRWLSAGGPVGYDAAFASAIGGYPKGTVLSSATLGGFWLCTADNNTTNPDTGGANWVTLYSASLGASGWVKAGIGGFILQWGTGTTTISGTGPTTTNFTLPTAFPNGGFVVLPQYDGVSPPPDVSISGTFVSLSQIGITVQGSGPSPFGFYYIAIGH